MPVAVLASARDDSISNPSNHTPHREVRSTPGRGGPALSSIRITYKAYTPGLYTRVSAPERFSLGRRVSSPPDESL